MRVERKRDVVTSQQRNFLFNFRRVAVRGQAVGAEIVGNLAKKRGHNGLAASACGPRFGVHHDIVGVHQIIFDGGVQPQNDRGGVAAGVGDQLGLGDFSGVQFGQAVNGLVQQVAANVFALVPCGIGFGIAQAKICRKVNNLHTFAQQQFGHVHGSASGHSKKNHIAQAGGFLGVKNADHHIRAGHVVQKRIKIAQPLARFSPRTGHGKAHGRVAYEKPRQFHARIAGNTHQTHIDCLHAADPLKLYGQW